MNWSSLKDKCSHPTEKEKMPTEEEKEALLKIAQFFLNPEKKAVEQVYLEELRQKFPEPHQSLALLMDMLEKPDREKHLGPTRDMDELFARAIVDFNLAGTPLGKCVMRFIEQRPALHKGHPRSTTIPKDMEPAKKLSYLLHRYESMLQGTLLESILKPFAEPVYSKKQELLFDSLDELFKKLRRGKKLRYIDVPEDFNIRATEKTLKQLIEKNCIEDTGKMLNLLRQSMQSLDLTLLDKPLPSGTEINISTVSPAKQAALLQNGDLEAQELLSKTKKPLEKLKKKSVRLLELHKQKPFKRFRKLVASFQQPFGSQDVRNSDAGTSSRSVSDTMHELE